MGVVGGGAIATGFPINDPRPRPSRRPAGFLFSAAMSRVLSREGRHRHQAAGRELREAYRTSDGHVFHVEHMTSVQALDQDVNRTARSAATFTPRLFHVEHSEQQGGAASKTDTVKRFEQQREFHVEHLRQQESGPYRHSVFGVQCSAATAMRSIHPSSNSDVKPAMRSKKEDPGTWPGPPG